MILSITLNKAGQSKTDRPAMTTAVDLGRKATKTNKNKRRTVNLFVLKAGIECIDDWSICLW